jgi:hypothetical protein
MALEEHAILGSLYLGTEDFRRSARVYGCKTAVDSVLDDELKETIALASRAIDAYCAQAGYEPDVDIIENHPFDIRTRRVYMNAPPVLDLKSFVLRISPGNVATFVDPNNLPTPEQDAGGRKVSWGPVYYSHQEKYLELAAWTQVAGISASVLSMGLMKPQVEIKYRNTAGSVDKLIAAATGYQTAHLLNLAFVDNQIAPGLTSMVTPTVSVTRESRFKQMPDDAGLHPTARMLLKPKKRICIA